MGKKYWKWAPVITLAAAVMATLAFAQAQNSGRGPGMRHRNLMQFLARQLQLTDAQQAQIKSLWEAEKPAMTPLLQQLSQDRHEMLALTANGNFDQNVTKIKALAEQQSHTMAQLLIEKEKLISQVYNQVLTPAQRTKADQMRARRAQHLDRWMEPTGEDVQPQK